MPAARNLEAALENIRNPHNWANPETILRAIRDNPSLRGIVYGYVSEVEFERHYLVKSKILERYAKDDDHRKTKADRTVIYKNRPITIQIKSVQTNSIRWEKGKFRAVLQNDASDRRRVKLPDGTFIETTCYVVGEYDILAVSLHPFTGKWKFAFKLNSELRRTASPKYTEVQRKYLLATLEEIEYPLAPSWTDDFESILKRAARAKS